MNNAHVNNAPVNNAPVSYVPMNPDDCAHPVLVGEGEMRRCGTCGVVVPKRTVREHLNTMRDALDKAKEGKAR